MHLSVSIYILLDANILRKLSACNERRKANSFNETNAFIHAFYSGLSVCNTKKKHWLFTILKKQFQNNNNKNKLAFSYCH